MVKHIDSLTEDQRATFPDWEAKHLALGLSTEQLTEEQWEEVGQAALAAAKFSNLPTPLLIRVSSPLAAHIAAAVAPFVAAAAVRRSGVWSGVESGVRSGVWSGVESGVRSGVWSGVESGVESGVWSGVQSGVWSGVWSGVESGVRSGVWSGVESGVRSGVWSGVRSGVRSGVWSGVQSGVQSGVRSGVQSGVESGVWSGVWSGVESGVQSGVGSGVQSGVQSGVWSGVQSGVWSGVWSGVGSGVESGVGNLLDAYEEWLHEPIRLGLQHAASQWSSAWIGGNTWASDISFLSWFREVGLELDGDLWERFAAYEGICQAGPSAWHRFGDLAVAAFSDRPTEIHVDNQGRSHREDGPAIVYADGWALNVWHGMSVPDDFFTWDIERVLKESNSEIRRAGIERLGWETVIDRLTLIASAPDPGNAPHEVALYDLPDDMQLYDERDRILVVQNASLDKGGHRRVFGLPVPAEHSDPIAAAADLFGVPKAAYAKTVRAS